MTDGDDIEKYREYIKKNLSAKRFKHSVNVAEVALKLAKAYKADTQKAYIAGLLHDVCKEIPESEQLVLMGRCDYPPDTLELESPSLYHAVAGSTFIKEHFKITDETILRAVRYHTAATDKMSKVEVIVYLADLISADRQYDGVEDMRKLCFKSLDKAMLEALKFQITSNTQKGNYIIPSTMRAYNEYVLKEKS